MEGDRSKRRQVQRTEKQVDISSGVEGRSALRRTSRSSKDHSRSRKDQSSHDTATINRHKKRLCSMLVSLS